MIVEIQTFRLGANTEEPAFLEADVRVQTEVVPRQPGFLRRTTARARDGEWMVVVLWGSEADATTAAEAAETHPAGRAFFALVDQASLAVKRYETLD